MKTRKYAAPAVKGLKVVVFIMEEDVCFLQDAILI